MSKLKDQRGSSKPQTGEFRSVRASVWRELATVRDAATGHFKDSLIKRKPASIDQNSSLEKKK
jgi:hypothetical protein